MKLTAKQVAADLELAANVFERDAFRLRARTALPPYAEALQEAMEELRSVISWHLKTCVCSACSLKRAFFGTEYAAGLGSGEGKK